MSDESDVRDVDDDPRRRRGRRAGRRDADVIEDAQAAIDEARRRVAEVPAEVVVTNHVMGLYELAAIHLSADQPDLASAALAIDAVACLVDGLGDRLGAEASTMRDALANIRIAFVQIKGRADGRRADRPESRPRSAGPADAVARRRKRPTGRRRPGRRARDALGAQQRGLAGGRVGGQAAVAAHDPPPRQVEVGASASSEPTARDRPGNPASSATSP